MLNSPNNPNSPRLQPPAQPTSPVLQLTPRVGPSTSSPAQPVNASINQHGGVAAPSQPEFAEFLTPAKLRPKRRKGRQHLQTAVTPVEAPLQAGPSHHGYTTTEGDLFRGTVSDPTRLPPQPQADDDAITIGGSSSTSSSSSWSWQSDLERGRRATMAVIERLGGAIGVRRGSVSTISTLGTEGRSEAATVTRRGRLSRILTRTATRGSGASSPERPKRQHLPRKREFTLLLPPDTTTNNPNSDRERVIRTPSLPTILERVRTLRQASGWSRDGASTPLEEVPIRRGGSAPGSTRPRARGAQSFVPPPIPARPGVASRAKSRVEALRMTSGDGLVRPKSVSDLMGLKNPYGSFTSLSALGEVTSPITEVRAPNPDPKGKGKGCWWLDVSCPGWEDLRDLGEVGPLPQVQTAKTSYLACTPSLWKTSCSKTHVRSSTRSTPLATILSSLAPSMNRTSSTHREHPHPPCSANLAPVRLFRCLLSRSRPITRKSVGGEAGEWVGPLGSLRASLGRRSRS